jgi:hypothetical protein
MLHDIVDVFNFEDKDDIFWGNSDLGFVDSDANDFSTATINDLEEQPPRLDSVIQPGNEFPPNAIPALLALNFPDEFHAENLGPMQQ